MSNLFWLTEAQIARLQPFFPKSHGKPRVDDRRVLSGIIFINRNGLRWCDAPPEYGPPKTLYNRWKRWSDMGVNGSNGPGATPFRRHKATKSHSTAGLRPLEQRGETALHSCWCSGPSTQSTVQ